jgi:hypothetical protein
MKCCLSGHNLYARSTSPSLRQSGPNELTMDARNPLTKIPKYTTCRITLEPLEAS